MKPFDYMRFDLQPDRDVMAYAHEPGEDFWLIKQMLFFVAKPLIVLVKVQVLLVPRPIKGGLQHEGHPDS